MSTADLLSEKFVKSDEFMTSNGNILPINIKFHDINNFLNFKVNNSDILKIILYAKVSLKGKTLN